MITTVELMKNEKSTVIYTVFVRSNCEKTEINRN